MSPAAPPGPGQERQPMMDLAPEAVLPLLRGRFGRAYEFVGRCESTQTAISDSAAEGTVVAADEQTAGRGRLGRQWHAPPGTSLLFSLALTPRVQPDRLPQLTQLTAHSVAAAIAAVTELWPQVKYPNDVLLRGRKVAGILGEARERRVVLGIGINVNVPAGALPGDADTPPTSLLLELGEPVDRAVLLATILVELERRYDAWLTEA